jgi:hypothetical protein
MKRVLLYVLLLLFVAGALVFVQHYVPLQPAVVTVYLGLGLLLVGLISIVKPLRLLGVRRRARALLILLAGAALALAGFEWPASTRTAAQPHQRLDDFMPAYEFYERHEAYADAPVSRVADAVKNVSAADIPVATWLMRIRALAYGHFERRESRPQPIQKTPSQRRSRFLPLDPDGAAETVHGFVGRPWAGRTSEPPPRVETPEEFIAFNRPGNVKVAFNIAWSDAGGGRTRIATETRIIGTDDHARRTFARYWRVIYPGSAIIRRAWLDAIVAKAERGTPGAH